MDNIFRNTIVGFLFIVVLLTIIAPLLKYGLINLIYQTTVIAIIIAVSYIVGTSLMGMMGLL